MAKFTSVLGSLAEATKYVGNEQYVKCSAVLSLEAFLSKVNDDDPGYIARFIRSAFKDFSDRIEGIDALPTLQLAVALDPRYKKFTFLRIAKQEKYGKLLTIQILLQ